MRCFTVSTLRHSLGSGAPRELVGSFFPSTHNVISVGQNGRRREEEEVEERRRRRRRKRRISSWNVYDRVLHSDPGALLLLLLLLHTPCWPGVASLTRVGVHRQPACITVKCLKTGHLPVSRNRHLKWGARLLGSGRGGGAQHFGHGH